MADDFKVLVRISNTDVSGNLSIARALRKIKGVSYMFSNAICKVNDLDENQKVGLLKDDQIKKIESTLSNPSNIPSWLFNRRKDYDTGNDIHITTAQLKLRKESDIKTMQKIKSYKGFRHQWGLPVRGQRTRAHFRSGKSVGVMKKAIKAAAASGKKDREEKKGKEKK